MELSQTEECQVREQVVAALKTIEDPELFLDIWFLGLIYRVEVQDGEVEIDMTFTSPMCPAGPMLIDQVRSEVSNVDGVKGVQIQVVFDPPWTPSDDVKAMLGMI